MNTFCVFNSEVWGCGDALASTYRPHTAVAGPHQLLPPGCSGNIIGFCDKLCLTILVVRIFRRISRQVHR